MFTEIGRREKVAIAWRQQWTPIDPKMALYSCPVVAAFVHDHMSDDALIDRTHTCTLGLVNPEEVLRHLLNPARGSAEFAKHSNQNPDYVGSYLCLRLRSPSCRNGFGGNVVTCVRASPGKGLVA
jgi:hypothetical protein